jgi:hypothetical protein
MTHPESEFLGVIDGPGGQYSLDFHGEDEGAAVIRGPWPVGGRRMVSVPEVHRQPADNAAEARAKLVAWLRAQGWDSTPRL